MYCFLCNSTLFFLSELLQFSEFFLRALETSSSFYPAAELLLEEILNQNPLVVLLLLHENWILGQLFYVVDRVLPIASFLGISSSYLVTELEKHLKLCRGCSYITMNGSAKTLSSQKFWVRILDSNTIFANPSVNLYLLICDTNCSIGVALDS